MIKTRSQGFLRRRRRRWTRGLGGCLEGGGLILFRGPKFPSSKAPIPKRRWGVLKKGDCCREQCRMSDEAMGPLNLDSGREKPTSRKSIGETPPSIGKAVFWWKRGLFEAVAFARFAWTWNCWCCFSKRALDGGGKFNLRLENGAKTGFWSLKICLD